MAAYIREVKHAEQTDAEERAAVEAESAGDWQVEGLVGVLEKVQKPGQLPIYYSGGLRILARSLSNSKCAHILQRGSADTGTVA